MTNRGIPFDFPISDNRDTTGAAAVSVPYSSSPNTLRSDLPDISPNFFSIASPGNTLYTTISDQFMEHLPSPPNGLNHSLPDLELPPPAMEGNENSNLGSDLYGYPFRHCNSHNCACAVWNSATVQTPSPLASIGWTSPVDCTGSDHFLLSPGSSGFHTSSQLSQFQQTVPAGDVYQENQSGLRLPGDVQGQPGCLRDINGRQEDDVLYPPRFRKRMAYQDPQQMILNRPRPLRPKPESLDPVVSSRKSQSAVLQTDIAGDPVQRTLNAGGSYTNGDSKPVHNRRRFRDKDAYRRMRKDGACDKCRKAHKRCSPEHENHFLPRSLRNKAQSKSDARESQSSVSKARERTG